MVVYRFSFVYIFSKPGAEIWANIRALARVGTLARTKLEIQKMANIGIRIFLPLIGVLLLL